MVCNVMWAAIKSDKPPCEVVIGPENRESWLYFVEGIALDGST
ncbi:hypothetical protein OKW39_007190 [Paraburkholderia sp. MM6662-R1]